MRTLLLIGLFLCLLSGISGQELGIRAGMDLYKFHQINEDNWDASNKFTASPGFGITFRMPFMDRSAFRTGLFYSDVGNEPDEAPAQFSQQFLKLPLQYGFTVVDEEIRTGFFLGPNLGYGLKGEYILLDSPRNICRHLKLDYRFFELIREYVLLFGQKES